MELPASSGLTPSGVKRATYSVTFRSASSMLRPFSHSLMSPERVCMARTKSFILATAASDGLITKSIPSSSTLRSKSVGTTEISHSSSWKISKPVISQSIQISREPFAVYVSPSCASTILPRFLCVCACRWHASAEHSKIPRGREIGRPTHREVTLVLAICSYIKHRYLAIGRRSVINIHVADTSKASYFRSFPRSKRLLPILITGIQQSLAAE